MNSQAHVEGAGHFDALAADWDGDEAKVRRAEEIARAIGRRVPLDPTMRVLEYGAGTGLVTQALGSRVGPATLADNSPGMRAVMARKIAAGTLPDARVWDLDLEHQNPPADRFDVVVTALVLHHVRELDRVLRGFATLLKPGGYLCIADLDREDGTFHRHDVDVHHGFDRTELAARLTAAGLQDVTVEDCTELVRENDTYGVFLAVGRAHG